MQEVANQEQLVNLKLQKIIRINQELHSAKRRCAFLEELLLDATEEYKQVVGHDAPV